MEDVIEVVACPVCGREVSMTDPSCPHCGAEFEPGTTDEPTGMARTGGAKTEATAVTANEHKGMSGFNSSVLAQISLLVITYAFGYGSIIAGNYVSSGGLLNGSPEMMLVAAGVVTIAASLITALLLGRAGNAETGRLSFSMIALFLLLIPPLFLVFHW